MAGANQVIAQGIPTSPAISLFFSLVWRGPVDGAGLAVLFRWDSNLLHDRSRFLGVSREPGNPNPGVGPDLKVSSCGLMLWFTSQSAPYDADDEDDDETESEIIRTLSKVVYAVLPLGF